MTEFRINMYLVCEDAKHFHSCTFSALSEDDAEKQAKKTFVDMYYPFCVASFFQKKIRSVEIIDIQENEEFCNYIFVNHIVEKINELATTIPEPQEEVVDIYNTKIHVTLISHILAGKNVHRLERELKAEKNKNLELKKELQKHFTDLPLKVGNRVIADSKIKATVVNIVALKDYLVRVRCDENSFLHTYHQSRLELIE